MMKEIVAKQIYEERYTSLYYILFENKSIGEILFEN